MIDIWFYGQACFKVKGKDVSLIFDPYDPEFTGLTLPKLEADIVCISHDHRDHNFATAVRPIKEVTPFIISGPGEYEKSGVNLVGVTSFHDIQQGAVRGKNTIYRVTIDGINITHLGDLGQHKLAQEQVEKLSICDVLLIPVGGVYTINAKDAPEIISQLEPKIIIPMHYKLEGLKFDLKPVESFLVAMGKEKLEPISKLSISRERVPEEPEVVILEKQ